MPKYCACGRATLYGKPGGSAVVCAQCVTDTTMINLRMNSCEFDGCRVCASYGPESDPSRHGYRCSSHKKPTDILKTGQMCKVCGVSASYGTKRPIHCGIHKQPGEHRVFRAAKCKCGAIAYWRAQFLPGMPGKAKRATHCTKCREPTMELTTRRNTCLKEDCDRYRLFIKSVSNDFCPEHSKDQFVLQCVESPCDKLIMSTYDKCRKHRTRTCQEPYNPCKTNTLKATTLKTNTLKATTLKTNTLKATTLNATTLKTTPATLPVKPINKPPSEALSLKKILTSWLDN